MKRRLYQGGIVVSVFALFFVLLASEKVSADATTNPRVQASDFQYLGAFRMPQSQNFGYANDGVAYNATNNSLFVKCMGANFNDTSQQKVAEVSIPTLVNSTNINSLNTAAIRQNCADITEGHLNPQNITNGMVLGGLLNYNNKLIGSEWAYYDGASQQTTSHFYHSLTLSQTGTYHGQYGLTVSPVYSGFVGGYMTTIPSEWQSLLGGPALTGSCCHAIISHQSTGPSVWVFDPDNLGVQNPVPATPLVYYTLDHPTLGTWGHPLPPNPVYNITTMITGVVFPSGTRSVILFGRTGLGDQCYGGTTQSGTGTCDDPVYPQDKGVHAYPYIYYAWMYDANDFLAVKNGTKNPWDITPYYNGQITLPFTPGNNQLNGAAYDPTTKRIYVSQYLSDNSPSYGFPIIHAFSVNTPTTPDTTPPTWPSGTTFSASATSSSSITVTWSAATDNIGVTGYTVQRCTGLPAACPDASFATVGTPSASPFVNNTGLSANTDYSYRVRATDAAGNLSGWTNTVSAKTQPLDTTPPTITLTAPTGTLPNGTASTTMSVTTNKNATCRYSTTAGVAYASMTNTFTTTGALTHSTTISGLTTGTTHRYVRCINANAGGQPTTTDLDVAITVAAPAAPIITSPLTASGTVGSPFSYTITANNAPTSFSATGLPAWGSINTTSGIISGTPTATGTTNVTIGATNIAGTDTKTLVITVTTAPLSPTFVSEYETAWNSATSPKTTANFSVQTGDILVAYAVNSGFESGAIATPPTGTLSGTWISQQNIAITDYSHTRLWTMSVTNNQTNINVSFTNVGSNWGADVLHFRNASSIGVTAQANSATGNPTLTMNGVSENSSIVMVNGDWSAKTGARTYNTTQAGAFTETSAYADGASYGVEAGYYGNAGTAGNKTIGITAPTGMKWALAAVEVKGNSGGGDTTPPTWPSGTTFSASATSSSSITATWSSATDNVGVTGYIVERCQGTGCSTFTQVGTPASSPFVDSGLTPNTFYNYHVRATDAAGNLSGWSNVVGATTQAGTSIPTVSLSANPTSIASGASSTLTWSSTNATSCTASGAWSGTKVTSGTQSVSPTSTSTYTLTCTGTGGSANQSATVTVGGGTACNTVNVSTVSQLVNAVNTANNNPTCSTTIIIADGTYTLPDTLYVNVSNMTVKSQSGDRTKVILQGDAMSSSATVKMIFRVDGNNFTAENMTLQRVGWHLIQVVGDNNRDNFTAKNLVFRNAWEQMLKVTYVDTSSVGSDNGLVENSLFEFTAGQAGQYYTGGIDAHNAKNWVVRGNTFKNIISPSGSVAEHAIHFWSNSEDTLVERNLIINCDRGIGFGLVQGRGHLRGIIRNNMIYHAAGNGSFADVSIEADESPNTQIYNNTIFMQNSYPNAIEYRFPLSSGLIIRNNLTNKVIQARDGATATLSNNITNAQASWFVNPSQGDLHLANGTSSANNAGTSISGLTNDYDGDARPQGGGIDVGADEYMAGGGSQSCNTVTANNFSQAAYNSYGAPYDAFQTSTNLMNTQCTGADTHTINLTTGVTGDTTRIVYTKGYWYDAVTTAWRQYAGTCTGALNGEWCQGSVSATITDPNVSTASAANPTYLVGMTCSVQGGSWKCGCRDTSCTNFSWQIQGAGLP